MLFPVYRAAAVAAWLAVLPAVGTALACKTAAASETSERELESLDAAARRYRVQVYETYRLDRAEFDRRRAAGDQVQARWREAGGRAEDLSAVIEWLRQATYVSHPEVRQRLPGLPEFGASATPKRVAPADPQRSDPKEMPPAPASRASTPGVLRRPPPVPRVNGYEIAPPRQVAVPATVPGVLTPPSLSQVSRAPSEPAVSSVQPRVARALLPAPWEVVSPAPSRPTSGVSTVPRRGVEIGQPTTATRAEQPLRATGSMHVPERAVTAAAPVLPLHSSTVIDVGQEPNRTNERPASVGNSPESPANTALPPRVPTVARRQPGNDRALDPNRDARPPRIALAPPGVIRSAESEPSIHVRQSQPAALPEPVESQLDVGELLARASGYAFGLRTIDSVLGEQASLDAAELAKLLGELEALVEQRGDLMLYEQLVTAEVRGRLIGSLAFPQATVAALGSRIAAARERLTQQSDLAAGEREVRLQALAELSKRLSRLSRD